ncbi:hypothetical protein [Mesorhizobium sp.]|uniref:hypothetical protein n=1 Tax=Mesorhizobium sp. TaxID=1871066 RepID=UPI0004946843|nr:hypothetical protein [Mesorhizobium sp.]TJV63361.1 MAG: hypothetical protein E5X82_05705 [Mesorhizobium sp.]
MLQKAHRASFTSRTIAARARGHLGFDRGDDRIGAVGSRSAERHDKRHREVVQVDSIICLPN